MNRSWVLFLSFLCSFSALASPPRSKVAGVKHSVVDVRALPERPSNAPPKRRKLHEHEHRRMDPGKGKPNAATSGRTVTAQSFEMATNDASPAPAHNFEALLDDRTIIPPDTMGAAGPRHLMVTLNSQVRILSKLGGAAISTTTLDAFSSATDEDGAFDPRLVYDAAAGRWIFVCLEGWYGATSHLLMNVSRTSDPTGLWDHYVIPADQQNLGLGGDFPSIGFNDSYVAVDLNMFTSGDAFDSSQVFVFDKAKLYAGTIDSVFYVLPSDFSVTPAVTHDAGAPLYFVESWSWTDGSVKLFRADMTDLTESGTATGPLPWEAWVNNEIGPQLGTTSKIDLGDDRIINAVMRNGYLYAAQTVYLPPVNPTYATVQWWKIAPQLNNTTQYRVGASTSAMYAYPSIAVNRFGDMLTGFSSFSTSQYAGAAYSYTPASTNAIGTPYTYHAGQAPYTKDFNAGEVRWGDYSATVVDPTNDVDFWTIQEFATIPYFEEDQWGTWWANVTPSEHFGDPRAVRATATSTSSVSVKWEAPAGATSYHIYRSSNHQPYADIGVAYEPRYVDAAVSANTTYLYKVALGATTPDGLPIGFDAATTVMFTDPELVVPVTKVKRAHVTELRTAVNAYRAAAGLSAYPFTDGTPATIKAVHLTELRNALNEALAAVGKSTLTFTNPTLTAQPVRAVDAMELRLAVQ